MEIIARIRPSLIIIEILSAVIFAACLTSLRGSGNISIQSWQLVGLYCSAATFSYAFFPLCYESWFKNEASSLLYWVKQSLFWSLTLIFTIAFLTLSGKLF